MDKQALVDYILDPSCRELSDTDRAYAYYVLKARYNEHIDFLYMLKEYNSDHATVLGQNPEYTGFVCYLTGRIYDMGYHLRDKLGIQCAENDDRDSIKKQIQKSIKERVQALINGESVPITPDAETPYDEERNRQNHIEYGAKSEGANWFFARKTGVYNPSIPGDRINTEHVMRFITDPDVYIAEEATAFIKKNARHINLRIWEIDLSTKAYAELENTPGIHHLRRSISECLVDAKKVTIHLDKDGKTFEGKITANALHHTAGCYYSTYHLDAADRRLFEEAFGRGANIMPGDIVRITYGKKTLYETPA